VVIIACAILPRAGEAAAQPTDTVLVTAGAHYMTGALHQFLLGRHYRDLWATPMRVPVLDLERFAGGLQPIRRGGGRQTKALRFLGADGREYSFRSVDKDPSPVLDSLLRETIVDDLVQDGISSAHPLGALVAAPLLDAVDVLHVDPQLRLMPDDPALGEFRDDFANVLGLIEENPDENASRTNSFSGAERVVGSAALMERIDRGPAEAVDPEAFLTARIVDVFLGDWDRHRDQWRWASFESGEQRRWLPIPKDRDQAFSKFDGVLPRLVSFFMPQFVRFEGEYPNIVRLHWNGRELDRRFLSGLERPVWDSIGSSIQQRLTDDIIADAVGRLPPEILEKNGEELRTALIQRRERLPRAWAEFYTILAEKVDIVGTAADEIAIIDREDPSTVVVSMWDPSIGEEPYLSRRFHAEETREIRVRMHGGDDRVTVRGVRSGITVRVLGGEGDDDFTVEGSTSAIALYDDRGQNELSAPSGVDIDSRDFDEWVWTEEDRDQPREWGTRWTPIFWSSFASDVGIFVGAGATLERFGFRAKPNSTSMSLRLGFAPMRAKGRAEAELRWNRPNSSTFVTVETRASSLDVIHYYGMGNNSPGGPADFHRVDERTVSVAPSLGFETRSGLSMDVGVMASASSATGNETRFFSTVVDTLYGATGHSQFGGRVRLSFNPHPHAPNRAFRWRSSFAATVHPVLADVESVFGSATGEISALLTPSRWGSLVVATGGRKVWGSFPWKDAAFLGGPSTLAGWAEQRFAGDASVYVRGEARLRVFRPTVVVPVDAGIFGVSGAGRVYLDGASPGGWHTMVGGGIWLTPMGQSTTLQVGFGVSEEATKIYASLGLPY
jgi:hypothetical protein